MAVLYTPKQIQKVLQELRIDPDDGKITTKEAARILTWRAENEAGVVHKYPESAVRRRTQKGHLKPAPGSTDWINFYHVEDVFKLSLYPKRGAPQANQPDNQYTENGTNAAPLK